MSVEIRCRRHPAYKGLRKPKGCLTCTMIWNIVGSVQASRVDYVMRFFSRVDRESAMDRLLEHRPKVKPSKI